MITIYGASWCAYCTKAKEYCELKGLDFNYVDVEESEEVEMPDPGYLSLPQVTIEGNFVGGYHELVSLTM